jgi:hypothetical protein
MGSLQDILTGMIRVIRRGPIRLPFSEHNKVFVHEVDSLNTTLDELPFPEQIDEPKAFAFGLNSSYVFHNFLFLIPRIHIYGAQAHILLLFHKQILSFDYPLLI